MAVCLSHSTTALEDFTGKTKCKVTIALQPAEGATARLVHIRYAGTEIDNESPFQFTIKKDARMLVVVAESPDPGALLLLVEVAGDTEQVLDRFHFDPRNPARGYTVRGL